MLSLEKISSRHIPKKILYPVTKPKTVFALSLNQRLASSVSSKLRFSSHPLHPLIFIELYLSIFPFFLSLLFSLFYLLSPYLFLSIYFHAKIKYVRKNVRISLSIFLCQFFLFHQLRTVVGGEVPLVSLREKEFECISTFP